MARHLTTGEMAREDWGLHVGSTLELGVGGGALEIESMKCLSVTAAPLKIRGQDDERHFISFIGPNGEVGCLDWEDGQLTFSGDMDESARIFLNCLEPLIMAAAETAKEGECKHRP